MFYKMPIIHIALFCFETIDEAYTLCLCQCMKKASLLGTESFPWLAKQELKFKRTYTNRTAKYSKSGIYKSSFKTHC